jgi:hypothetical protein
MAQYWMPLEGHPSSIAPSLVNYKRGVGTNGETSNGLEHLKTDVPVSKDAKKVHDHGYPYDTVAEPNNPSVVPEALLRQFHFTFLIRHPRSSIPSYYRCTVPPLDQVTGFYNFDPREAGYVELRALFDYLRSSGQVGPHVAGQEKETNGVDHTNGTNGVSHGTNGVSHGTNGVANGTNGVANGTNGVTNGTNGVVNGTNGVANGNHANVDITLIDADDMLDAPYAMIEKYCKSVGITFSPDMLNWDNEIDQSNAKAAFEKWRGFHDDAIDSTELRPRKSVSQSPH